MKYALFGFPFMLCFSTYISGRPIMHCIIHSSISTVYLQRCPMEVAYTVESINMPGDY